MKNDEGLFKYYTMSPDQVLLAAAYLDDARTGRHMEFEPSLTALRM